MHVRLDSTDAMRAFGEKLAEQLAVGAIVFLKGDLGAGKTTLASGILQGLGYRGSVKSPTYTLVETYQLEQQALFHFDFYRLNDAVELLDAGFADYLQSDAIVLIEWPEKAQGLWLQPTLTCQIDYREVGRDLTLTANCLDGEKVLQRLL